MRKTALILLLFLPCAAIAWAGPLVVGHALFALGFRLAAAPLLRDAGWQGYADAQRGDYGAAAAAFGDAPANAYNRGNALTRAGRYKQALDAYDAAIDADPEDSDARYNKAIVEKILDSEETSDGKAKGNANASARTELHHGASGTSDGTTNSVGIGFVGNKEGASNSGAQGGSKVSKVGTAQSDPSGSESEKASGSAGRAGGKGRSGGDLVDITAQLAANQRRYSPSFTAREIRANVEWLQTVPDDPGSFLKLQIRAEHRRREAVAARAAGDD
jgi:Ca-activated chloride channel family protein